MPLNRVPVKIIFAFVIFLVSAFELRGQDHLREQVDSLNQAYGSVEERSFDEAEAICLRAIELSGKIRYHKGEADAHSNLGLIFLRRSNSTQAIEHFFAALKLYEQLEGHARMEQYGAVLVRLGGIYYFDGDFERSFPYCRRGYRIAETNNFTKLLGISSRVIGELHRDQGSYDSAMHYFEKARIASQNDLKNLGAVYIDIGINYYYLKDYRKAIEYNKKFYEVARTRGLETDYAPGFHNIGEFYYQLKAYDSALIYLDSSLVYSTKFKQGGVIVDSYNFKAKVFQALGNADSVAFYFQKSMDLKDSMRSDTYQKELAGLNAKMDLYRHETENTLLKKDQRITNLYMNIALVGLVAVGAVLGLVLVRQKFRVQKSVRESLEVEVRNRTAEIEEQRATIENINLKLQLALSRSKVDPHFIFNVLNSIQHLVMEKKPQEASDHLARLARLTRYILEKSSIEEVPLEDEIRMLEQYIKLEQLRLDNKFKYTFSVRTEKQVFIPAMIIQPYIENAILHGLAPSKKTDLSLTIGISLEGDTLRIVVADNGVGRKGTVSRKDHTSIGASLGNERLRILSRLERKEFRCEYVDERDENGESAGTKVILLVPVKFNNAV